MFNTKNILIIILVSISLLSMSGIGLAYEETWEETVPITITYNQGYIHGWFCMAHSTPLSSISIVDAPGVTNGQIIQMYHSTGIRSPLAEAETDYWSFDLYFTNLSTNVAILIDFWDISKQVFMN